VTQHQDKSKPTRPTEPEQTWLSSRPENLTDTERPFAEIRKNVNDGLRVLYTHRWSFFMPACVAATIVFALSLYYPRTYMATTSFERRNDPVMMNLRLREGTGSFELWRSTMAKDLTSLSVMAEAVERLGMTRSLAHDEAGELTPEAIRQRNSLALSLASNISVTYRGPNEHVDFVTLTYTGADHVMGRKVLDEVKKAYIRWTERRIHDLLMDQHTYFSAEAAAAFVKLNEARQRETELRIANPLINPENPSQLTTELTQREIDQKNLELRRREYETELSRERQLLGAAMASAVAALPPELGGENGHTGLQISGQYVSAAASQLAEEIRRLKDEILLLRSTKGMTKEHPSVQELVRKRDWYQEQLDAQLASDATNPPAAGTPESLASTILPAPTLRDDAERARIRVNMSAIEQKLKEVDLTLAANARVIQDLDAARRNIHAFQEEYAVVKEQVRVADKVYTDLKEQSRQIEPAMRANEAGKLCKFIDQEAARGGVIPVSPKAATVFTLALMVALGTGAIFVLLAEVFDHVYRNSGQVSRSLGLPILESIDEIITNVDRRKQMIRRTVLAPLMVAITLTLTVGTAGLAYVSIERPWVFDKIKKVPGRISSYLAQTESGEDGLLASRMKS
jgi:hypothetical protein